MPAVADLRVDWIEKPTRTSITSCPASVRLGGCCSGCCIGCCHQRPAVIRSTIFLGILIVCSLIGMRASPVDSTNTGMADPIALEAAFDRSNGGQSSLLALSLANLRGVSSESLNAAGTVTVDLANGAVTSVVQLLPPGSFDLWLVDNRSRPGH